MKTFLSPGQVASLLHISLATVNYYTNMGLLCAEYRKKNMRLYARDRVLKDFAKIKQLRQQGYSLRLIQQQLHK